MTPEDRPWYGSSRQGDYRLRQTDSEQAESQLLRVCNDERSIKPAVNSFRGLEYIDSGWEWSVFRDRDRVYKTPAGRFVEVADPRYIRNAEINYQKILRYVDQKHVAQTTFHAEFIEQEWVDARKFDTIELRDSEHPLRQELNTLFSSLLILLNREDWLPDLEILPKEGKLEIKNWLLDRSGVPKIIDFTSYCDVFRMSERRLNIERRNHERGLVEAIELLSPDCPKPRDVDYDDQPVPRPT